MQFNTMDETLISIYNIRNIESIKLYDMVLNSASTFSIVPALLVYFDGGKALNLCAKDEYFDTLVKKVVEVYRDEKDNVLEDNLTDPFHFSRNIDIDEHSKTVIENGSLEQVNQLYTFYENKEHYEGSLFFEKDEVELLLPIVKYHIYLFLSNSDITIHFDDELSGYRNNYILSGKVNGIPLDFPITFQKIDSNKYKFYIGNVIETTQPMEIEISFEKDKIEVLVSMPKYDLKSSSSYIITNANVKAITNIRKGNTSIYYTNTDLEVGENELLNIANIDQESQLSWVKLPWDAYYGFNSSITDLSGSEKLSEIANMYLGINGNSFIKKEFFSKNYYRKSVTGIIGQNVCLDEATKQTIGICTHKNDGIYLIETAFLDTYDSSGYYNEKLKNHYFYHMVKSDDLKSINGKDLISISKDDEVFDSGDILSYALVLKKMGDE